MGEDSKKLCEKFYKLEPICILMGLHKLVDVAIRHPFRHHRELCPRHYHSQQGQHVWVAESSPCYELLAEPLSGHDEYVSEKTSVAPLMTHASKLLQVAVSVSP